ncbi:hypothetical protein DSO57_1030152 [Entomophthora muscae]|uniref:Uncharacterized protein n=1 Tax=Entomophthora muscae TaxID=34485 RepID=A0ACC2RS32_9FUNG|nr:hypothetical protein DSO57_1030152 [Entomophthora muscae]
MTSMEKNQPVLPREKIEQVDTFLESETVNTSEKGKLLKGESKAIKVTQPKVEASLVSKPQVEAVVVKSETKNSSEISKVVDGESEVIAVTQPKDEVSLASKPQVEAAVDSGESVKDVKEDLNNSLPKSVVSDSNGSADKVENKGLISHEKSTENGASEPEKPKIVFGQTLNDPKYSWLSNFGKSTLGSNAQSFKPQTNNIASMFQGFKASANSSLDDKETKAVDFGALLMKAKDTEQSKPEPIMPKLQLIDEAVSTGEEDEETLFEATGKLHVLGKDMKWTERGVGQLRINALRSDIFNRRIIMRLESVHKVILNVKVVPDLKPTAEGKFVRFSAFETEGSPSSFTFRTSAADIAEWMVEELTY